MDYKEILNNHLETISGIADRDYQERVWIRGEGPEWDDYTESICYFYDIGDSVISNYKDYEINDINLSLLVKLRDDIECFRKIRYTLGPDFLYSPDWHKVTMMAKKVLEAFNYQK